MSTTPTGERHNDHAAGGPALASRDPAVAPSLDDPVVDAATEAIGGPLGRFARRARDLTNVTRVLVIGTLVFVALGVVERAPCIADGWTGTNKAHLFTQQYTHLCYSDAANVYQSGGFMAGLTPYLHNTHLGFPVLTAAAQQIASLLAHHLGTGLIHQTQWFYAVTVWFLLGFAAITVIALIGLAGRRPWDAAMFAFAPVLLLSGTINWDLIAVGLTTAAMLAWARHRPGVAGLLLGFAEAVKFYPAMLLVALVVLCWRAGRMRSWLVALATTIFGWALVNVPVLLIARKGWGYYFTWTRDQVTGNGSLWMAVERIFNVQLSNINVLVAIAVGVAWLLIVLLGLLVARRPRFPQLAFLVVAAFVVFDKVYSPQDALWLMPLAVLARPRWRDYLIWQACEIVYYVCVWLYLLGLLVPSRGLPESIYTGAILLHLAGVVYLCVRVVRDIVEPDGDPVRVAGDDDPAGGCLDDATDVYGFRAVPAARPADGGASRPAPKSDADQPEQTGDDRSQSVADSTTASKPDGAGTATAVAERAAKPEPPPGRGRWTRRSSRQ